MPSFKTIVGALALFGAAASAMPYESSPAPSATPSTSHSSGSVHCKAPYKAASCDGLLCQLIQLPIVSGQGNANACCSQDQDNSLNVNVINCAAVLA